MALITASAALFRAIRRAGSGGTSDSAGVDMQTPRGVVCGFHQSSETLPLSDCHAKPLFVWRAPDHDIIQPW